MTLMYLPHPNKDYALMSDAELIKEWKQMRFFYKNLERFFIYEEIKSRNLLFKIKKSIFLDPEEFLIMKVRDNAYIFDYENNSVASELIKFIFLIFISIFFIEYNMYTFVVKIILCMTIFFCFLCVVAYCTNFVCITNKRVFKKTLFSKKSIYFDEKHIVCDIGRGVRKEDSFISYNRGNSNFQNEDYSEKNFRLIIWITEFQTVGEIFPTRIKEKEYEFYFPRRVDLLNHIAMEVIFRLHKNNKNITSIFNERYELFNKNIKYLPTHYDEKLLWRGEILDQEYDSFMFKFDIYKILNTKTFFGKNHTEKYEMYVHRRYLYVIFDKEMVFFNPKKDKIKLENNFIIRFCINGDEFIKHDILIRVMPS